MTVTAGTMTQSSLQQYHDSFRPNCATYIMKHVSSDDDNNNLDDDDDLNNCDDNIMDDDVLVVTKSDNDEEGGMERTLVYDENFNSELSDDAVIVDSVNGDGCSGDRTRPRAKYFKIAYTKEEIHSLGLFMNFLTSVRYL